MAICEACLYRHYVMFQFTLMKLDGTSNWLKIVDHIYKKRHFEQHTWWINRDYFYL